MNGERKPKAPPEFKIELPIEYRSYSEWKNKFLIPNLESGKINLMALLREVQKAQMTDQDVRFITTGHIGDYGQVLFGKRLLCDSCGQESQLLAQVPASSDSVTEIIYCLNCKIGSIVWYVRIPLPPNDRLIPIVGQLHIIFEKNDYSLLHELKSRTYYILWNNNLAGCLFLLDGELYFTKNLSREVSKPYEIKCEGFFQDSFLRMIKTDKKSPFVELSSS